jgi:HSP20 family protein
VSWDWRRDELEGLFSDLAKARSSTRRRTTLRPAVDVFSTGDPPAVVVVADLAGVDPGDIELSFADGVLTLAGLRRRQQPGKLHYERMELDYGPFERRVDVGEDVDSRAAEAVLDRGLLTVRFPRLTRPSPPLRVVIAVVRQS